VPPLAHHWVRDSERGARQVRCFAQMRAVAAESTLPTHQAQNVLPELAVVVMPTCPVP